MGLTVSIGTSSVIGDWVVADSLRVFAPQHQASKADTSVQKTFDVPSGSIQVASFSVFNVKFNGLIVSPDNKVLRSVSPISDDFKYPFPQIGVITNAITKFSNRSFGH